MPLFLAAFLALSGTTLPAGEPRAQMGSAADYTQPSDLEQQDDDSQSRVIQMSYEELFTFLLDRGLTEEAARRYLDAYETGHMFTPGEINDLLRRVRPEDLATRRKESEKGAAEEARPAAPTEGELTGEPRLFGMEVFRGAPSAFEPDQDLAAGSDYRLGPGDELRIALWGSVQREFNTTVDREGSVTLPEVGVLPAAGMTLGAFETRLQGELSRVFRDFQLGVSLRRLRRIQVVVAGEVVRPGAYFLSPVSTTFNALYYAGGPTAGGTLRRVRVVRDGRIIAEVDLYRYLMGGETAADVRLLSGDTIFLLPRGAVATARGEFRRPAIYELRGGETVADLARMAGGFTSIAQPSRASLDRVSPATGPVSLDLDLIAVLAADSLRADSLVFGSGDASLPLQDGDELTAYSIYHLQPRQFVEIQGMVQYPGIYPLYPGYRASDLIFRAGGLLDSSWLLMAELSRIAPTPGDSLTRAESDSVSRVFYVKVSRAIQSPGSEDDVMLARDDKLYIRRIPGWKLQETVKVSGEVVFPGIYPLLVKRERLSQVIRRAGGLTNEAFPRGASLFREKEGRVIINFEKVLARRAEREDIVLVDGDSIHVPAYPPTILVQGEVGLPGALLFEPGKTAGYYVGRTGGLTDVGDRGQTRIVHVDGVVQKAFRRLWWDPKVEPGARILVGARRPGDRINWGSVVRDTTAILASLATTFFIVDQITKN